MEPASFANGGGAMRNLVAITLGLIAPIGAHGQSALDCSFANRLDQNEKLGMKFLIDPRTSKAYVIGSQGANEVQMIRNVGAFTLIEITKTGNVMTTTITNKSAVHSRNSVFSGELLASQFLGSCVVH
jgi:uncharacterized protein YuzE